MTYFTHHSQCPKCAEIGKDNNGDNLANYSDGSSYCFSCHFSTNKKYLPKKENKEKPPINFPTDGLFELTVKEVKNYKKGSLIKRSTKAIGGALIGSFAQTLIAFIIIIYTF